MIKKLFSLFIVLCCFLFAGCGPAFWKGFAEGLQGQAYQPPPSQQQNYDSSQYQSQNKSQCLYCGGTGQKECIMCSGTGNGFACYSCGGSGFSGFSGYGMKCMSCGGRGFGKCITCGGRGFNRCRFCNGTGYK